jgi:isopenicillin N synthase-like dioxygenase
MFITCSDLTNMKSSDVNLRQALGKEIRDACINVGFFYGIRQVVGSPYVLPECLQ